MPERLGRRLALAGASLLLALLFMEAALRLVGFRPLYVNEEQLVLWRHDPLLGWHHVAGRSARFGKEDFDTEVRINTRGLRDAEHPYRKPDGTARILALGDSLVWGFGVEQEEIFTEVLERTLDGVEVINAGVSGFGTDQELIWLEQEGFRYEPDLVLVVLTGNDIWGNQTSFAHGLYHKPRYRLDPRGGLELVGSPAPEPPRLARMVQWLRRRSALFELAHLRLRELPLIDAIRGRLTGERRTVRAPPSLPAHGLTYALIDRIAERSRERGAHFLVVVTDDFWSESSGSLESFVAGLRARGTPMLLNRDDTGYDRDAMTFAHDPHWNAAGHAQLARRLAELLLDCRPGDCRPMSREASLLDPE